MSPRFTLSAACARFFDFQANAIPLQEYLVLVLSDTCETVSVGPAGLRSGCAQQAPLGRCGGAVQIVDRSVARQALHRVWGLADLSSTGNQPAPLRGQTMVITGCYRAPRPPHDEVL